ncbi:hypothetical protein BRYFOR_06840 [Marvinbryantia formatexigens DSM 14469]|uniref:Uncharacterized protein n=1 Tax=Marvinbryantia formatexigens DSM 14469 TaxID=478749 RepID=C6LDZ1_9FIRM|nr:hypothetical protein BRYFOR_06840 [Marvinbryantia formatexigens DSM 14469]
MQAADRQLKQAIRCCHISCLWQNGGRNDGVSEKNINLLYNITKKS